MQYTFCISRNIEGQKRDYYYEKQTEFKRRKRESSKVYTELLLDVQYKNLDKLGKYDYAIYNHKKLVDLMSNKKEFLEEHPYDYASTFSRMLILTKMAKPSAYFETLENKILTKLDKKGGWVNVEYTDLINNSTAKGWAWYENLKELK